jgi:hypothetical protein
MSLPRPVTVVRCDLGEISPVEKRDLDKRVRIGELKKARLPWSCIDFGTCIKTCWFGTRHDPSPAKPHEGGERAIFQANPGHRVTLPLGLWPLTKNASPEPTLEPLPEPYAQVRTATTACTNTAAIFSTSTVRCHSRLHRLPLDPEPV